MGLLLFAVVFLALFLNGLIIPALWLALVIGIFALIVGGFVRLLA